MDKKASKIVDKVETYLRNTASLPLNKRPTPNEIELHITELFVINSLVSELFSIEVIPIDNTFILRPRNSYTSIIMGALLMFYQRMWKTIGVGGYQRNERKELFDMLSRIC